MASVSYRNVSKRFDAGSEALADFNLDIADGEFMVLVGPSGCGKSTALRLLAGLESVSSGEILIGDAVVNDKPPQQRNVAMVFQNYALYPHMSVRDNLAFPLKMMKVPAPDIRRRVQQAASLLELSDWLHRKPAQLSGGQRQRVAMGRAIVRDPQVFLMDEPLSNLDARLRTQIRTEIAALQQRTGTTTLYVTHDQVEAMSLGDRVAVMNAGRVQQLGTPRAVYEQPANTFVAGFIGTPGMNLFPGRVQRDGGTLILSIGECHVALPPAMLERHAGLPKLENGPLQVGVRPEDFQLHHGDDALAATVDSIESLGHEQLVYFSAPWTAGRTLVARLGMLHTVQKGQTLQLRVDPARYYLFDDSGEAI
jgi:ABC-type sugar transport system ATPase subunit